MSSKMPFKSPKSSPRTKQMASASYEFLFGVYFSETNPERTMTQILERLYKLGKVSRPTKGENDGRSLNQMIAKLSTNPKLEGFDSPRGRAVLNGWAQSAFVELGATKKGGGGALAVDYLRPLTAAAFRAGFPKERSRHRGSDVFIYRSLLTHASSKTDKLLKEALKEWLIAETNLGLGMDKRILPPYQNPQYDEETSLDVNVLLQFRLLEGVEGLAQSPNQPEAAPLDFPVPLAGSMAGRDFFEFARNFGGRTTAELAESLVSLMAFRLFQLPLVSATALEGLLGADNHTDLNSVDMNIGMFFDFTDGQNSASARLAKESVRRDLGRMTGFFESAMRLRAVEEAALSDNNLRNTLAQLNGPDRLQKLIDLQDDPLIEIVIGMWLKDIEDECAEKDSSQLPEIHAVRSRHTSHLNMYCDLLMQDRQKLGLEGIRKWLYSTGGLVGTTDATYFACISGTKKAPTTWKYQMSDSLFRAILDLCFVKKSGKLSGTGEISMAELITILKNRFGILVNEIPGGVDDPESAKAVAENYSAFVNKLKVMGYFRGLSDDFNAQRVQLPSKIERH